MTETMNDERAMEWMRYAVEYVKSGYCEGMKMALDHIAARLSQQPAPSRSGQVAVPDGYRLVPIECTEEMEDAGNAEYEKAMLGNRSNVTAALKRKWKAMVLAAQQPAGDEP